MPLLAPLPTHQISASESHVVPSNDLVKLATPPALQVVTYASAEKQEKQCGGGVN